MSSSRPLSVRKARVVVVGRTVLTKSYEDGIGACGFTGATAESAAIGVAGCPSASRRLGGYHILLRFVIRRRSFRVEEDLFGYGMAPAMLA